MFIYIENNILIDYEQGKKELPSIPEVNYVYSYVHIQELQELKNGFDEKKDRRLQTIEELTACWYVSHNDNHHLVIHKARPSNILALFETPLAKKHSQTLHEKVDRLKIDEFSKCLFNKLSIEKKVINNFTPEMLAEKYGNIIWYYVEQTCDYIQEMFQSLFNILDALGFWQDKVKAGSSMNRSYDANHAYFATMCDYFVTDDKKTRNKANVCYKLCRIKTKAVSYNDFISLIKHNYKISNTIR